MAGVLFPDLAGALSAGASAGQASAQGRFLIQDRTARDEIAPLVPKALAGDKDALGQIGARHPDTAMKIAPLLERMEAGKRAKIKEDADFITQSGMAILNAPPAQQPQLYAQVRADAQAKGRDVSSWPTQYDPGWVKFNVDKAMPFAEHFKRSGEGVTFAPPAAGDGQQPPTAAPRTAPKEWEPHFNAASAQYGVPVPLIRAVAGEESAFNQNAVSPAGAGGVMQIMPGTAKDLGVTNRFDPGQSINKGTAYLKQQMDRFGNLDHALAAYNWGPGNAEKWIAAGADPAKLPAETRNYIAKVRSNLQSQMAELGGPGGLPQGGDPPRGDGSGNPIQPAQAQQQALQPLRGLQIPPGARVALQGGLPVIKDGNVLYLDARGGWGAAPLPKSAAPKEQGAGPFAGTGMEQQATNILITGDPSSPEYAAAYAHMSSPRTQVGPDGQMTTIQPNVQHFRPPTGMAPPGGAPASGPAGTTLPGGQTATQTPGRGKPLGNAERDDLTKASGGVLELGELVKSFDPSFGGYMYGALGDAANLAKRNLPDGLGGKDEKGQAQWWQRYAQFANLERNKLFGSALTPGETAAFNAAMVNPGMKPEQITANLDRQREIATKALSRIANSMLASGYNKEAIESATGVRIGEMPDPIGGVPQAKSPAEKARDEFNANKAPVKVRTPEEANKLPSGTVFETPDGRIKVKP